MIKKEEKKTKKFRQAVQAVQTDLTIHHPVFHTALKVTFQIKTLNYFITFQNVRRKFLPLRKNRTAKRAYEYTAPLSTPSSCESEYPRK